LDIHVERRRFLRNCKPKCRGRGFFWGITAAYLAYHCCDKYIPLNLPSYKTESVVVFEEPCYESMEPTQIHSPKIDVVSTPESESPIELVMSQPSLSFITMIFPHLKKENQYLNEMNSSEFNFNDDSSPSKFVEPDEPHDMEITNIEEIYPPRTEICKISRTSTAPIGERAYKWLAAFAGYVSARGAVRFHNHMRQVYTYVPKRIFFVPIVAGAIFFPLCAVINCAVYNYCERNPNRFSSTVVTTTYCTKE